MAFDEKSVSLVKFEHIISFTQQPSTQMIVSDFLLQMFHDFTKHMALNEVRRCGISLVKTIHAELQIQ